jgi:hypothetical protein
MWNRLLRKEAKAARTVAEWIRKQGGGSDREVKLRYYREINIIIGGRQREDFVCG